MLKIANFIFAPKSKSIQKLIQPEYKHRNGHKCIDRLKCLTPNVTCDVFEDLRGESNRYVTLVKDDSGNIFGKHFYMFYKKIMYGKSMRTDPFHKKEGIGELMRLISLIEMKENDMKEIRIESLLSAMGFHKKYKFEADYKAGDSELDTLLKNIQSNKNLPQKIRQEARLYSSKEYQKQNITTVNKFIQTVLDKFSGYKELFEVEDKSRIELIPMKLTKQNVSKHADFFNSLFKKHGIDYSI